MNENENSIQSETLRPEHYIVEYELREDGILEATREAIASHGVDALEVNDLTRADLIRIPWSGGPLHPASVGKALDRVDAGEVDYLAVRSPEGWPVAIGGIDYQAHPGAGTLWQLSTHGELQGLGIGTKLIKVAEGRVKTRGVATAMLGVEDDNHRARALYERLGYEVCGHEQESWDVADKQGNVTTHHAEVTLMRKQLS